MYQDDCIFCQIVQGKAPAHKIWENEKYLAFLSIYPNTEGMSIVIPKEHHASYAFDLPDEVLTGLTLAAKQVGKLLDAKLDDVGRTGLVFEGFGIDHVHAKLYPLHGTKTDQWQKITSDQEKYFEKYEGYISTHDYHRADDQALATLAQKIIAQPSTPQQSSQPPAQ